MEQEYQDDKGVRKALDQLQSLIIPGEQLEAWAIQVRLFALVHRRKLIAATTGRLLVISRGLLGGFSMINFRWQDVEQVDIHSGILGSALTFETSRNSDLALGKTSNGRIRLPGLGPQHAEQVYRYAQAQDQAWREKRRIREMEELRARSGAFPAGGFPGGIPQAFSEGSADRLKQARKLLDDRLISDAEYEAIKAKIISNL